LHIFQTLLPLVMSRSKPKGRYLCSLFTNSRVRHNVSDGMKVEITAVECYPEAWHVYQILWNSFCVFKIYALHWDTNK